MLKYWPLFIFIQIDVIIFTSLNVYVSDCTIGLPKKARWINVHTLLHGCVKMIDGF